MREMRAIHFVTKLIERAQVSEAAKLKPIYFHMIEAEEVMARLGASSKLNGDWDFLCELRDLGRSQADAWLVANFAALGTGSSLDIDGLFI
jgi:NTE family protein